MRQGGQCELTETRNDVQSNEAAGQRVLCAPEATRWEETNEGLPLTDSRHRQNSRRDSGRDSRGKRVVLQTCGVTSDFLHRNTGRRTVKGQFSFGLDSHYFVFKNSSSTSSTLFPPFALSWGFAFRRRFMHHVRMFPFRRKVQSAGGRLRLGRLQQIYSDRLCLSTKQ